jgi:nucleoid-associated protein YgaU
MAEVVTPTAPATFVRAKLCEQENPGEALDFHFNPSTIKIAKRAEWQERTKQAAKEAPRLSFTGTHPVDLSFSLLLDSSRRGGKSVMGDIQRLLDWTNPTKKSRRGSSPSPPVLMFTWGELTIGSAKQFVGVLTSVDASCTMFSPNGAPTRAEVSVSLKSTAQDTPGTNPTSGGVRAHEAHQVLTGDTLAGIAYQAYGDASRWRAIAELNGIDDPMRLPVGARLLLPEAADVAGW